MKKVGVAILGLGGVGGETYRNLTERAEFFRRTQGVDLSVESVLEPDRERVSALGVPGERCAANIAEVVCNADADIIVEAMGGAAEALEYVLDALNAGKTAVITDTTLICLHARELERAAKSHNAGLYFGASCPGGIPVVRTLLDGVQSSEISSLTGVLDGTANDILTRMEKGCSYAEALKEATAETGGAADGEGYGAAYSLSLLASLSFHTRVPFSKVFREGIADISAEDITNGKELGYVLKFLAIAKQGPGGIEARVHPAFIKKDHPLASAEGRAVGVYLTGEPMGDLLLLGKGEEGLAAGSAVVSDILHAATRGENKYRAFKNDPSVEEKSDLIEDFRSAYYLRLNVADRAGAFAKVAAMLAKHNISIAELLGENASAGAPIVLVTHETHESAVKNAAARIDASGVATVEKVLRVVQ